MGAKNKGLQREVMRQIRKNSKRGMTPTEMLYIQQVAKKNMKDTTEIAIVDAVRFVMYFSLQVLMSDYWTEQEAREKAPEFVEEAMKLFMAHVDGVVTKKEMDDFLWDYAGVKIDSEGVVQYDELAKQKASKATD